MEFVNPRAAKEYLIETIKAAAVRAGQPLSADDVARFDGAYDEADDAEAWERRAVGPIKYARAGAKAAGRMDDWYAAVRMLKTEDHYLVWLLNRAGERPKNDLLKLFTIGLALLLAALTALVWYRYSIWN